MTLVFFCVFGGLLLCALVCAALAALMRVFWNRVIVEATTAAKPINSGQAFALCIALGFGVGLVALL